MNTDGKFYIGRDAKSEDAILYDPDDLTTHAVVVGMTGSGKTGLCIDLLEERWGEVAADITQIAVNPLKKDILVELFGVAWLPYHVVEAGGRTEQLAGYGSGK